MLMNNENDNELIIIL